MKSNKAFVDDIFEDVKLPPLKMATLFKLNFYLAFKAYNNENLETYLKNRIQKAKLRVDSKTDLEGMQKGFSKTMKRNIVKRKHN